MPARIYRIWIELDEYDPDTDQWQDIAVDFGPSAEFASDASEGGRARTRAAALALAEHIHMATALVLAEAEAGAGAARVMPKAGADGIAS